MLIVFLVDQLELVGESVCVWWGGGGVLMLPQWLQGGLGLAGLWDKDKK